MNKLKYNLTLAVVFLAIIWVPLQSVFLKVDAGGRVPTFLIVFALLFNLKDIKRFCFKKPVVYYMLLAPYMFVNGLVFHSNELYSLGFNGYLVLFGVIFLAPFIMLLVIHLCRKNYKKTLFILGLAIVLYSIMCISNGQMVAYSDGGERLVGVANSNEVALMMAIGFSIVLTQYVRGELHILFVLIVSVFLFIAVFATGSRMGFGMGVISVIVSILLLRKKTSIISNLFTLAFFLCAYLFIDYVLDSTYLGERISETTSQTDSFTVVSGTILDKFGDRGLQYYFSWPFFLQKPIFGIGFHQWMKYNPSGFVCHSEYMVQYLECGIIGFTLYFLFIFGMMRKLWECRNEANETLARTAKVLFATLCSIIFASSVLWNYNSYGVFAIYGLSYAIIHNSQNKTTKSF